MERLIGYVKIFNVVAGIIIIVGVIVIAWTIIQRSGSTGDAPDNLFLELPQNGRVIDMVSSGGHVILLIEAESGAQRLVIVDPANPKAPTTLQLKAQTP